MKILITGSNGLLGQKLIELYEGTDNEIIATSRGENRLKKNDSYQYESLDICDDDQVFKVFEKYKPEVVINTAAMTNVDQCELEKEKCWDLNVNAVENLVKASQQHDSFLLHLSTDFIFDGSDGPYSENSEPNPISFYGWSKLASEKLVENSGLHWAIARTILVYGTAQDMSRSNIILWVKNSLENSKTIQVVSDQWRTPTLAEDLAIGCKLIADNKAEGIFNIAGAELLNPYQMAQKTAAFFKLDNSFIVEADAKTFSQTAKRPARTGLVIEKIEKLGYKPRSFDEGIALLEKQITQC